MWTYDQIAARAARDHLSIMGGFRVSPDDALPDGAQTLLLLGPREPGFWSHVTQDPVFRAADADPMDTWSTDRISQIAQDVGGQAVFPFGGPPWHPFIAWAKRSGRAWESPVALLVHDTAGLMISYRGALVLNHSVALPPPPAHIPCETCARPCLSACPAGALGAKGYDTTACHSYLDTADGASCMTGGCHVRRACPVSQSSGRLPDQSAFHMRSFHP